MLLLKGEIEKNNNFEKKNSHEKKIEIKTIRTKL